MFEKEAEEMAEAWLNERYLKGMGVRIPCKEAYKTGFQDGYNRAFVEADKNLKAIVTDFNKANEWHFVSKEGFPNKDDIYLIIRSDGLHLGDYCCGGDGDIDCQSWCDYPSEEEIQDDSVIAWKEIVFPKEIKENEN